MLDLGTLISTDNWYEVNGTGGKVTLITPKGYSCDVTSRLLSEMKAYVDNLTGSERANMADLLAQFVDAYKVACFLRGDK